METHKRLYFILSAMGVAFILGGCSLMLDPENCESNSDCNGGICTDGICVGEESRPDMAVVADMAVPSTDQSVETDEGPRPDPDMTVPDADPLPADAAPDMAEAIPPTCDLTVATELTSANEVGVNVTVEDADDDLSTLAVRLNDTRIDLDAVGRFEGTVPLNEGPNTLHLVVVDGDNQRCEDMANVEVDRTPPSVEIIEPAMAGDNLTNLASLLIRGTVTDAHFGQDLVVLVNDMPRAPDMDIVWSENAFELTIQLTTGPQTVGLIATDELGNASEAIEFEIELDDEPPEIQLQSPVVGEEITVTQRRYQVRGRLLDMGRGIRNPRVSVTVQGPEQEDIREYPMAGGGVTGDFTQWVELFDGRNEVRVCGYDEAGNETCLVGEVTKNAPCINLETPSDGDYVGSLLIQAEGTVCPGVTTVSGTIDGGAPVVGELLAENRFRLDIRALTAGPHVLTVRASDNDDASATAEISVTVDPSPPTLTFREPQEDLCVGASVLVIGTAEDAHSGLQEVTVNGTVVDGIAVDGQGGEFRQQIAVDAGERAREEITLVAVNRAGLSTERSTFVQVDTVAPLVEFDVLNLAEPVSPWLRPDGTGRVQLSGTLVTGQCGVAQGGFVVNDLVATINAESRFEIRREFPDGQHTARWTVTDIVGNEGSGDYTFRVDSLPPVAEYTNPESGSYTTESQVSVQAQLSDAGSGVHEITINDNGVQGVANAQGQLLDTSVQGLVEGPNSIEVTITDAVGNSRTDQFVIHRDTTPPQVTVSAPQLGVAVPVPLTVTGTVTDDLEGGEGVEAIIGSGVTQVLVNEQPAEYNPETGQWVLRGLVLDLENPQIVVTATDAVGNTSEPMERALQVRDFGVQSPDVDGLTVATSVGWLGVADLNNDGHLDIVALTGQAGGVSASYVRAESGEFSGSAITFSGLPEDPMVYSASLGDLDANGTLDLVATTSVGATALSGVGNGAFEPVNYVLPALNGHPQVSVGDLNRDGRLDLLMLGDDALRMMAGDAEQAFVIEDAAQLGLAALSGLDFATSVDLDSDGVLDVVAVSEQSGGQVWLGSRDNTFSAQLGQEFGENTDAQRVLWLDADRNGTLDAFVYGAGHQAFYLNDGSGNFTHDERDLEWRDADSHAAVGDMNGDGRDDLVIGGTDGVRIWRNGAINFTLMDTQVPGDEAVTALAVEDIDGDGDFDIIIGTATGVQVIKSNRTHLDPNAAFVHIRAMRQRNPAGDNPPAAHERAVDGIGTYAFVEYLSEAGLEDPSIAAEPVARQRAIRMREGGPTLINLGSHAGLRAVIHFVDVGNQGRNTRVFNGLVSGANEQAYSPE